MSLACWSCSVNIAGMLMEFCCISDGSSGSGFEIALSERIGGGGRADGGGDSCV